MTGFSEPRYFKAAKLELSAKAGVLKWLKGSFTLFLHWFLSNMWAHSNWWFSFWISLASVMKSLPSFPDCQCLIHLHQVPSRKIRILLLFVLKFYRLQEIGRQRKIEQNLPMFSVELLSRRSYAFTYRSSRISWVVAVPGAGRGGTLIQCPLEIFCFVLVSFRFLKMLSSQSV